MSVTYSLNNICWTIYNPAVTCQQLRYFRCGQDYEEQLQLLWAEAEGLRVRSGPPWSTEKIQELSELCQHQLCVSTGRLHCCTAHRLKAVHTHTHLSDSSQRYSQLPNKQTKKERERLSGGGGWGGVGGKTCTRLRYSRRHLTLDISNCISKQQWSLGFDLRPWDRQKTHSES